jgi:hypothetical protein
MILFRMEILRNKKGNNLIEKKMKIFQKLRKLSLEKKKNKFINFEI